MLSGVKERITALFKKEKISQEDQVFWFMRLAVLPHEKQIELADFFALMHSAEFSQLRSIQERKERALASHDVEAWEDIVQAEKEWLEKLNINA